MTVGSIMTRRVVTVGMDDSLETVREIFRNVRFHHLLVVGDTRLVGILSDRDYLKSISPYLDTLSETTRDRATLQRRVHQIMTRNPISVAPETDLEAAAKLLLEKGISCLPVTTSEGLIEGIVTWKDLFRALLRLHSSEHMQLDLFGQEVAQTVSLIDR